MRGWIFTCTVRNSDPGREGVIDVWLHGVDVLQVNDFKLLDAAELKDSLVSILAIKEILNSRPIRNSYALQCFNCAFFYLEVFIVVVLALYHRLQLALQSDVCRCY